MRTLYTAMWFLILIVGSPIHGMDSSLEQCKTKEERFVVVAPPKCGTHLVAKALEQLLDRPARKELTDLGTVGQALKMVEQTHNSGGFVVAHNWNDEMLQKLVCQGYKIILILRDPRDQVLSVQRWFREGQWQWLRASQIEDPQEQLEEIITGARFGWSPVGRILLRRYHQIAVLPSASTLVVRFEHLVGEEGGGKRSIQIEELMRMAHFLNAQCEEARIVEIAEGLFGDRRGTFRKGQIEIWRNALTSHQRELFRKLWGSALIELGYESDYNW